MRTSQETGELFVALIDTLSRLENPKATAKGQFDNRYAPLPDVVDQARTAMQLGGLAMMQEVTGEGDTVSVTTVIIHSSNQWIELGPLTLPAGTPQQAGSAITYARRYQILAALLLAGEEDDDAAQASRGGGPAMGKRGKATPSETTTPASLARGGDAGGSAPVEPDEGGPSSREAEGQPTLSGHQHEWKPAIREEMRSKGWHYCDCGQTLKIPEGLV